MKRFAIVLLALALCACESDEQRAAEFNAACVKNGFTPQQCVFLAAIKADADEAAESSAAASMSAGMAMGMAAGSAGRR